MHRMTQNATPAAEDLVPYEDLLKQLTTQQHAILIDLGKLYLEFVERSPHTLPGYREGAAATGLQRIHHDPSTTHTHTPGS